MPPSAGRHADPFSMVGKPLPTSCDQRVPLQLIMAKTRHKSPRTVMRYVKPGDEAVAGVTSLLGPPRRSH
jgi:hypothetical protein